MRSSSPPRAPKRSRSMSKSIQRPVRFASTRPARRFSMPRPWRRSGSDRARATAVARIAGSERPLLGSTPMSAICAKGTAGVDVKRT